MALDAVLRRDDRELSWWNSPSATTASTIYRWRQDLLPKSPSPSRSPLKIVCISDTHNTQPSLPPGDLLIHAGDLTQGGTLPELQTQLTWLTSLPHTHKLLIAGNHDILLDASDPRSNPQDLTSLTWGNLIYLQDSHTTLHFRGGRALKIYGSPWTRKQGNWAFQYPKGADKFSHKIDTDTDIVVTHSPPLSHLDRTQGDGFLLRELWRVRPRLSVFGHIHAGNGRDKLVWDRIQAVYEAVCAGEMNGLVGCLWMVWLLLVQWLFAPIQGGKTTLVNAAAVGGISDRVPQRIHVVEI